MAKRTTYHHGDLRRALLDASLALVDEAGIGALSLREVARKAGVSHNAPYHHFPDRGSLLAAIAEDGFIALASQMAAARAAAPTPRARLEACGIAYVRFAIGSPAHFRVMFRPELASPTEHPRVHQASVPALDILVQGVIEAQAAGLIPAGDPMPFVLTCWSAVHGLATLWLDGPLSLDTKGFGKSLDKLATMVVGTLSAMMVSAAGPGLTATATAAAPRPRRDGGGKTPRPGRAR
jgi:AcrR family transcriptional regulator